MQAGGTISLADLTATTLKLGGGAGVSQVANTAVVVSDAITLDTVGGSVVLANAGNSFPKVAVTSAANVSLTDLRALDVSGTVGGNLQVSAKGNVTQAGVLNVGGTTNVSTGSPAAGEVILDNLANKFIGAVSATGTNVALSNTGDLTINKITGTKVELLTHTKLLMTADGKISSPDLTVTVLAADSSGAIGSADKPINVQDNAKITLSKLTPALPAFFGGQGLSVLIDNSAAKNAYITEQYQLILGVNIPYNRKTLDTVGQSNVSLSKILRDAQKKADSSADVVESGMPIDLTERAAYPHEGALKLKGPCEPGKVCE